MTHASLDVLSPEFFNLFDALAPDASRVEESSNALEGAKAECDAAERVLTNEQTELEKLRAFIQEQKDRIRLVTTHWFFGTTLFQPQLWLRGGCKGKKKRAERKLLVATNEKLPEKVSSVNESETRLSQMRRDVEDNQRIFELSANAASERQAMKARAVLENPSSELLRFHREGELIMSRLETAKIELESLDTVVVKIGSRQEEHSNAVKFLKTALTHKDRHDILKNNPVEMQRPIDVLQNTELHESSSEAWLPNGTKSVLIRTKTDHQKHLFRVDKHNRLLMTNSPCPNECGFLVTWHGTYCCNACASGRGCHGGRCERMPLGSQEGAKAKFSKWKADQRKRDKDMKAALTSCNENVEKAMKCMQNADELGSDTLTSFPLSVVERHPGPSNSFRHKDHSIATSLRRSWGCSKVEFIHQQISAVEGAQATLTEQISMVEHLVCLVKDDVQRFEQRLMTVQSLEEEESNQIFRRLREQVSYSAASVPPPMNPGYTQPGSVPLAHTSHAPVTVPSAPMEEEILLSNAGSMSGVMEAQHAEEASVTTPSGGFGPTEYLTQSSNGPTAHRPYISAPPEAIIMSSHSVPTQETIPMVNATLIPEATNVHHC